MPIIQYHLVEGQYTDEQLEHLMVESSRTFAEVLRCPVDRTRVFIHGYPPGRATVGGVPVSRNPQRAPYFEFVVLEGRSLEDRQKLLVAFTDLVVQILQVDRAMVRGSVQTVHPENWAIGGVPAAVARQAEVAARAGSAGN